MKCEWCWDGQLLSPAKPHCKVCGLSLVAVFKYERSGDSEGSSFWDDGKTDQLSEALKDANDMCRSAMAIAKRDGKDTYWGAFRKKLEQSLIRQHAIMYPKMEQTPTPRTDAELIKRSCINGPPNSGADSGSVGFEYVVTADFARAMELELIAHQETIRWIASQENLFFAECSQAEEIVERCRKLLPSPPRGVTESSL